MRYMRPIKHLQLEVMTTHYLPPSILRNRPKEAKDEIYKTTSAKQRMIMDNSPFMSINGYDVYIQGPYDCALANSTMYIDYCYHGVCPAWFRIERNYKQAILTVTRPAKESYSESANDIIERLVRYACITLKSLSINLREIDITVQKGLPISPSMKRFRRIRMAII